MISKDSLPILGDERAVSPVIGVALMIGIVVVLGGAIGFAVLDFGDDVGPEPQASADVEQLNDTAVRVTWVSEGNSDYISFSPTPDNGTSGVANAPSFGEADLDGADEPSISSDLNSSTGYGSDAAVILSSTGQSVTLNFDGTDLEDEDVINIQANIIDTEDSSAVIESVENPTSD